MAKTKLRAGAANISDANARGEGRLQRGKTRIRQVLLPYSSDRNKTGQHICFGFDDTGGGDPAVRRRPVGNHPWKFLRRFERHGVADPWWRALFYNATGCRIARYVDYLQYGYDFAEPDDLHLRADGESRVFTGV